MQINGKVDKIAGFIVEVYHVMYGFKVLDTYVEYGASPIRDKRSMLAFCASLEGVYPYAVFPILQSEVREVVRKAMGA